MHILDQYRLVGVDSLLDFFRQNAKGEYRIEQSSVVYPERNPFLRILEGVEVVEQRTLLLYGPGRWGPTDFISAIFGLWESLDNDKEAVVGRVFAEGGDFSEESGYYEFMKVRFVDETELKSGVVIPKCTIKVCIESVGWTPIFMRRRDHIRKGFYWRRTDLSSVLPDGLFLADPRMEYERR